MHMRITVTSIADELFIIDDLKRPWNPKNGFSNCFRDFERQFDSEFGQALVGHSQGSPQLRSAKSNYAIYLYKLFPVFELIARVGLEGGITEGGWTPQLFSQPPNTCIVKLRTKGR